MHITNINIANAISTHFNDTVGGKTIQQQRASRVLLCLLPSHWQTSKLKGKNVCRVVATM